MLDYVLQALFPSTCGGCGTAGSALCPACTPHRAAVRRLRFGELTVFAAGAYAGPLRATILAYKHGRRDAGDVLAALLAANVAPMVPGGLLVPVPTAPARRRARGFDQGVRLAVRCGAATGRLVLPALVLRCTDAQRGRAREARLRARGRFGCDDAGAVCGERVVLVDDVVTTGATLADCAAALRSCGASVAFAMVLAYA